MAFFSKNEPPTDEPFKQHLTPFEVATATQGALSALWLGTPADRRSLAELERSAAAALAIVEKWWLQLPDRAGFAIVSATQESFGPLHSARDEANAGTLAMETMAAWMPKHEIAQALFWAWLLQSEKTRTPSGTVSLVRQILERQVRNAGEDMALFNSPS
jgi:hypothetical protein